MKIAKAERQGKPSLGMRILKDIQEATYHPFLSVYQLKVAWQGQ